MGSGNSASIKAVGIGASAGGLEAAIELLSNLPAEAKQMAFILAQHLSPNYKSMLVQLLSKDSKIAVAEAKHGQILQPGHIYITPPDHNISVEKGKIQFSKPPVGHSPKPSVDLLLMSLAKEYGPNAVGVILSGTGTDGSAGMAAIKNAGGLAIVQLPEEAKYDGMPQAAITACAVDYVVPAGKIGNCLSEPIKKHESENEISLLPELEISSKKSAANVLFKLLSEKYGTNFSNYKQSTIYRRLNKRMQELKLKTLREYAEYVQNNAGELETLYYTFLIGVTEFFRDREAFEALNEILNKLVAQKETNEKIRIWVAGCSTGEEAYSIAILLFEIIGEKNLSEYNIQIFATDIDDDSIAFARKATYSAASVAKMSPALQSKYFYKKDAQQYELSKAVRSLVLFSKQDVTANPPFLKLDLISCRNLLIYFTQELQEHVFPIFHYALNAKGILFLGKSESVGSSSPLFESVDSKNKIFVKKPFAQVPKLKISMAKSLKNLEEQGIRLMPGATSGFEQSLKEALISTLEHPFVVVNSDADVIHTQGNVNRFLSIPQGMMNANLYKLAKPELQIEVRAVVAKAIKEKNNTKTTLRRFKEQGSETIFYRLVIRYLPLLKNIDEHFLVMFETFDLDEDLQKIVPQVSDAPVEARRITELEQELSLTKEHLQSYIEEVETSNEELQTLNEELQSSNEELQSSNEELETGNEELQSSNEELQIAYAQLKLASETLREKDSKISELNAQFQSVLSNTLFGYILLAKNYTISYFNNRALELLKHISGQQVKANQSIIDVFPGETVEALLSDLKEVFAGTALHKTLEVKNANGKSIWLEASMAPVSNPYQKSIEQIAISLQDVTDFENNKTQSRQKTAYLSSLLKSTTTYLIRTDMQARYTYVNDAFYEKFGMTSDEVIGLHYGHTVHADDIHLCEKAAYQAMTNPGVPAGCVLRKPNPDGGYFHTEWEFITVHDETGEVVEMQGVGRDITDRVLANEKIFFEKERLAKIIETINTPVMLTMLKDGYVVFYNQAMLDLLELTPFDINKYPSTKFYAYPIDREKIMDILTLKGEVKENEVDLITLSNKQKTVLVNAKLFDYFGQKAIYTSFLDITEIKKQRDTNKFNSEMLLNVSDALVATDLQGRVIYYNKGAEKIYGYTVDEMMGQTLEILYPDQDFSEYKAHLKDILAGNDYVGEWSGKDKWGNDFHINIKSSVFKNMDGEIIGYIGMAKDITEGKKRDAELKKTVELLKKLTDNVPGAIYQFEYNPMSGAMQFPFISQGIKELHPELDINALNHTPETIFSYVHPDDVNKVKLSIKESAIHLSTWNSEYRVIQKDKSIVWHKATAKPEKTPEGIIVWYGYFQDITAVKKAYELIDESFNRFTSFADNSPVAFYIYTTSGTIVYGNKFFHSMLGKAPDSLTGFNLYDKFDINMCKTIFRSGESVMSTGNTLSEEVEVIIEGELKYLLITKFPIKSGKEITSVGAISVDITDKKRQEHELILRERRLKSILDSGSHFIIRGNLQGQYTFVNQAYENIFGQSLEALKGKSALIFVHPDDSSKIFETIRECTANDGKSIQTQIRKIDKNGNIITTLWEFVAISDFSGNIFEIQAVGWDISDIEAQKDEIKKLALVAQRTKNAVLITDNKGVLEWANEGFTRITGYLPEELIGKKPGKLLQGADTNPETVKYISEKIKHQEGFNVEIVNYSKSGQKYWLHIEAEPILDEIGKLIKYIAIETDITEKKEHEIEREKLIGDLIVKNKNLEEFSYILSHNLRGPVANIIGLVNIFNLSNNAETNKTIVSSMHKMATQLDEVIKDVNRIISYRQNLSETKETIHVKSLLTETLNNIHDEISPIPYTIYNNIDDNVKIISIKAYLQSIFHNLITNAIKYRHPERPPVLTFQSCITDHTLNIMFIDNGLGIDLDLYKDNIFMLYKRFHSHIPGKGMGLFMTKQQAQLLGGTIEVESKPNEGAQFILKLPLK